MKKNKKQRKDQFVDDNRTIVEMNVDGFPWYDGIGPDKKKSDKKDKDKPTKKELVKMIFGMYGATLPFLLITIGCFLAVFVVLYLVLKFG